MARAPSKRGGRTASHAPARGRNEQRVAPAPATKKTASYEDDLFFMRLRRHQKWLFALLAAMFFLGFVVLGIGSGNGFLIDAFQSIGGADSSIQSVEDAQNKVDENPDDPAALFALATALQADAKTEEATGVLERYVGLQPDDADALHQLAALYDIEAAQVAASVSELQVDLVEGSLASTLSLLPSSSGFLGAASQDPIDQALTNAASAEVAEANAEIKALRARAVPVYQALVALTPDEPLLQLQLAEAAFASEQDEVAIAAYEAFLELAPEDPAVPAIEARLSELRGTSDSTTG